MDVPPVVLARLLERAARRLQDRHDLLQRDGSSALGPLLEQVAGPDAFSCHPLRTWMELLARSYCACTGEVVLCDVPPALERVVASFAASIGALEILDDLIDGDMPIGERHAPNLALALLGESLALLPTLPDTNVHQLNETWGHLWSRCAAAQARDLESASNPALTVEQALQVAQGSGLVTRWAVEAGALLAGASSTLRVPLVDFGQHLGTAEKLLHDLHDLWPGPHPSRDLHRPTCNPAVVLARATDVPSCSSPDEATDDSTLRLRLRDSGVLHYLWFCADDYRLRAATALDDFARAGGDPRSLYPVLHLPAELRLVQTEDTEAQGFEHSLLTGIHA